MSNSSKKYKLIGRVIFLITPSLETKFSTLEELHFLLVHVPTHLQLKLNCNHGNYRRLHFIMIMLLNCIKLLCLYSKPSTML